MHSARTMDSRPDHPLVWLATNLGRLLISIIIPIITFVVLWQGFLFLRDSHAPKN